jgi:fimbrial chaperone protein
MISSQVKNSARAVVMFIFFCASLNAANAQQVSVSPLRITFKNDQQSEIVTIRNTSKQTFTIQPKVLRWTQKDGQDVHEPSRDVIVAPPIVEVPAGETQVIRLALMRAPEANRELSYRLFIQQVVAPQKFNSTGLSFAWNLSLPIFVLPTNTAITPKLQWNGSVAGKTMTLTATNTGGAHIQVKKVRVETSAGVSESGQMFYLLPSQQLKLAVPVPGGLGKSVVLIADTDVGEMKQEVALE